MRDHVIHYGTPRLSVTQLFAVVLQLIRVLVFNLNDQWARLGRAINLYGKASVTNQLSRQAQK